MKRMPIFLPFVMSVCLAILTSAASCRSGLRTTGGSVKTVAQTGATVEARQSENPKDATTTSSESHDAVQIPLHVGDVVVQRTIVSEPTVLGGLRLTTNTFEVRLASDTMMGSQKSDRNETKLGAAQKDVIGETIAKLGSMRWLQYVGILVFLLGVATIALPWLRLLVGSITSSVIICGAGLGMMVLPVLVVGHELEIMGVALAIAAAWWLAHRHGSVASRAATLEEHVDRLHELVKPEPTDTTEPK